MSKRVDTTMQAMEPPVRGPASDGRRPEAEVFELSSRDHAMLPSSQLGQVLERVRSYFCSHGMHKYERTIV